MTADGRRSVRRWLFPSAYPTPVLLLFLAVVSVVFAWVTFDLVGMAMENAAFLTGASMMSMMAGDLGKLAVITAKGLVALFCYLAFKGIEREVVGRWVDRG